LNLELMPFHRMGQDKYRALNMTYRMEDLDVMSDEDLEALKSAYMNRGINCTVSR
jgi:pyruvate formate lyase activating enzyme